MKELSIASNMFYCVDSVSSLDVFPSLAVSQVTGTGFGVPPVPEGVHDPRSHNLWLGPHRCGSLVWASDTLLRCFSLQGVWAVGRCAGSCLEAVYHSGMLHKCTAYKSRPCIACSQARETHRAVLADFWRLCSITPVFPAIPFASM
jgi:hypothetical protein